MKKIKSKNSFQKKFQFEVLMVSIEQGKRCPIILCDLCKERITSASDAMIFWNDKDKSIVAHKKCMCEMKNNQIDYPSSYELSHVLGDLIFNTGNHDLIDWAKSETCFAGLGTDF